MSAEDWCQTAEQLLRQGAALMAYDAARDGLRAFPDQVRLQQLVALALARAGASAQANELLRQLHEAGHADEETLGMLARTHKDLATLAASPTSRRHHLRLAHQVYLQAYRATSGYWTGINAATTALLLGQSDAASLAEQVRLACRALVEADPGRPDRYWLLATLGEACLVLGQTDDAERWYRQAVNIATDRLGDRVSTRRNARLILQQLGRDTAWLDACFAIPRVVVFAGHLIDRPERSRPRFPPALEASVARAVRDRLATLGAGFGYASAACGGDLIFLEALGETGVPAHIVLPYNREQFVRDCVDIVPGAAWRPRFDAALTRAAEVTIASEHPVGRGGASFEYAFRLLDGAAALRAQELDTELVCLAVWDGAPGDGAGGTASAVAHWAARGRRLEIVGLGDQPVPAALPAIQVAAPAETRRAGPLRVEFEPSIVGLLFADAPGFSQLSDVELPVFVDRYLGLIRNELARLGAGPLLVNTWGDGLYVAFDSVRDTGRFALRLCEAILATDWRAAGLRTNLSIRVGLHAGPAYGCTDPVTGRLNYIGAHVSRAARIEPITPPGAVYASSAFAALAKADGVDDFTCVYVGPTPLAKGYGTFPTYLVRPVA